VGELETGEFGVYESTPAPLACTSLRNAEGSVLELTDGRLLLAYDQYYGPPYRWDIDDDFWASRVTGKISEDFGRSWGDEFLIKENDAKINILAPSLLRLQSGEIALFYRKTESINPIVMTCYMKKSFDEGETWSEEICIPDRMPGGMEQFLRAKLVAPAPPDSVIQLSSGRIIIPASRDVEFEAADGGIAWGSKITSLSIFSDDNGETWQRGESEVSAPKRGAMEPHIVELEDGRLIMIVRTQMGHVYRAYSEDGGEHWSEGEPVPEIEAPESCIQLGRIPGTGDLLLVYNRGYDPEANHSGKRNPLSTAISKDAGETWGYFKDIVAKEHGVWEDQQGKKHEWSWVLSNPGLTFAKNRAIISYCEGCPRHFGGIAPCSLKVMVMDVARLYDRSDVTCAGR